MKNNSRVLGWRIQNTLFPTLHLFTATIAFLLMQTTILQAGINRIWAPAATLVAVGLPDSVGSSIPIPLPPATGATGDDLPTNSAATRNAPHRIEPLLSSRIPSNNSNRTDFHNSSVVALGNSLFQTPSAGLVAAGNAFKSISKLNRARENIDKKGVAHAGKNSNYSA